jgi:hypothetical protein
MLFHGGVEKEYIHTFANNLSLWFKHCAYFQKSSLCLAWWEIFFIQELEKCFGKKIN